MRAVSAGDTGPAFRAAVRRDHTSAYADGFCAALDHFHGHVTHGTELGASLGLVAAYAGFYGQADWSRPVELPGHS